MVYRVETGKAVLGDMTAAEALTIIDGASDMETAVIQLRDLLGIDHVVYHSSRFGASPSVDPYIRLTYPADWVKRYLQMGYLDVDPVLREGFLRALPFDWSELKVETPEEGAMLLDALSYGVGPHGFSIPVQSKRGHRGLFSISSSKARPEWDRFCQTRLHDLIEIANALHKRMLTEELGEEPVHLSKREIECLFWTSQGKDARDIAAILAISQHTTRDYLKSARYKLNCVSSAQAVTKAASMGILRI